MVIKALAMALMAVPDANVTWTEGGMLKHKHADVGVAVSIPGGLITPVVRHAETKTLSRDLQRDEGPRRAGAGPQARSRRNIRAAVERVSNLGMFGDQGFRRRHQPAARDDPRGRRRRGAARSSRKGKVEVATIMTVTLSTDHRAVDGALGAELLGAFKTLIEKPAGMLA